MSIVAMFGNENKHLKATLMDIPSYQSQL